MTDSHQECIAEGVFDGVVEFGKHRINIQKYLSLIHIFFGGEDHDSSGYEFDVFSGVEHFCKVVDCCVRV